MAVPCALTVIFFGCLIITGLETTKD